MELSEKQRLLGILSNQFYNYLAELEEYDSKNFPDGANRTDTATLDDFAFWLINQGS